MLEKMSDFFTARVKMYDEHMLSEVEGCKEGYIKMATLVPTHSERLLDLGCGTGLELDEIFKLLPHIKVTGIDLTQAMLDELYRKHPDKDMQLICADYFQIPLGKNEFDCAVSFQTMHHFSKDKKLELYKKIYESLKDGGIYIECDYMVITQKEEDFWFSENDRIRKEQGVAVEEFYHYDTPCTVDNQMSLLREAGFISVEPVFRMENTTMLLAAKKR